MTLAWERFDYLLTIYSEHLSTDYLLGACRLSTDLLNRVDYLLIAMTLQGSAPILAPGKRLFPHLRPHPTPQP